MNEIKSDNLIAVWDAIFALYSYSLASGKAIKKISRQSLRIVVEYLQAWNQLAGDRPKRDFWWEVFNFVPAIAHKRY